MRKCALSIAVLSLTGLTAGASADVLVNYDFAGSASPSFTRADVTASAVDTVSGTNDGGGSLDIGRSGGGENLYLRTDATPSTMAAALDDDDYFEFTIGPSGASPITLGSISFDSGGASTAQNEFETTIYLQSSLGGFGSSSPVLGAGTTSVSGGEVLVNHTIALDSTFESLDSPITFRFYASDNHANNDDTVRVDNIVASEVVPEPTSVALFSGFLGLAGMRRRRGH